MTQLQTVIQKIQEKTDKFGIVLNPPATTAAIEEFERVFEVALPADIRSFYMYSNGFETDDFMFRMIPLEEAVRELLNYDNGVKGGVFIIADYLIYSDSWRIRFKRDNPNTYEIINDNHESEQFVVLTNSIFEFIAEYLQGSGVFGNEGLYKWFETRKGL